MAGVAVARLTPERRAKFEQRANSPWPRPCSVMLRELLEELKAVEAELAEAEGLGSDVAALVASSVKSAQAAREPTSGGR